MPQIRSSAAVLGRTNHSRSREKCQRCRRDKQKCLPFERDWDVQKQRCFRCERIGHPCGPPAPGLKKDRKRNSTTQSATPLQEIRCAPSTLSKTKHVQLSTDGSKDLVHSVLLLRRFSFESEAVTPEFIKGRLANTLATLLLLLRCQQDIRLLDGSLKCVDLHEREHQFDIIYHRLQDEFDRVIRLALSRLRPLSPADRQQEEQELKWWLYRERVLRCQRLLIQKSSACQRDNEADVYTPIYDHVTHEYDVLLCTEYVLVEAPTMATCSSVKHDVGTSEKRFQSYQVASKQIEQFAQEVLQGSIRRDVSPSSCVDGVINVQMSWDPSRGFPPFHIAYLNHDRVVASKLWEASSHRTKGTDLFGRTYSHIVAQAHDLQVLGSIATHDDCAIRDAGRDAFGHSLLDIATLTNNRDVFAICANRGAVVDGGRTLLHLATRADSLNIVKMMLENRLVHPPFNHEMHIAIEYHHIAIALSFLPYMTYRWQDSQELMGLAELADRHEFFDLRDTLLGNLQDFSHHINDTFSFPGISNIGKRWPSLIDEPRPAASAESKFAWTYKTISGDISSPMFFSNSLVLDRSEWLTLQPFDFSMVEM